MGFPKGRNIGVLNSEKDNDIFFLNNDTRLTPNSLFWLRMGLYDKEDIGATGASYAHLRYICPNLSYTGYECNTAYVPLFVSGAPLS